MFKNVDFRMVECISQGNKGQDDYKGPFVRPGMTFHMEIVVFVGYVMHGLVANI